MIASVREAEETEEGARDRLMRRNSVRRRSTGEINVQVKGDSAHVHIHHGKTSHALVRLLKSVFFLRGSWYLNLASTCVIHEHFLGARLNKLCEVTCSSLVSPS